MSLYLYGLASPWGGVDPLGLYDTVDSPDGFITDVGAKHYYHHNPGSGMVVHHSSGNAEDWRWLHHPVYSESPFGTGPDAIDAQLNAARSANTLWSDMRAHEQAVARYQKDFTSWWSGFEGSDCHASICGNESLTDNQRFSQIMARWHGHYGELGQSRAMYDFYRLAAVEIGLALLTEPAMLVRGVSLVVKGARGATSMARGMVNTSRVADSMLDATKLQRQLLDSAVAKGSTGNAQCWRRSAARVLRKERGGPRRLS